MTLLEVTISLAVQWPTREEIMARNNIEDALNAASIGKCTGVGAGMHQMHVTFHVDNDAVLADAQKMIADAMKAHMPTYQFEVRIDQDTYVPRR